MSEVGMWASIRKAFVDHVGAAIATMITTAAIAGAVAAWAAFKSWIVVDIPSGLVSASAVECSKLAGGWSNFDAAGGRFIVGAGPHPDHGGVSKTYSPFTFEGAPPISAGFERSTGGKETHQIKVDELPPLVVDSRSDYERSKGYPGLSSIGYDSDSKKYKNIDIIPPYIALYYCKKN